LREKAEMVELFKLDLVGVCFRSEFLEKKIQAVKQLGDIARNLAGNKFVKLEELMAWVKEQRVFEQLFSKTVHIQLLQRTSDFLRFLITNDRLELPLMEQVFELMTSDDLEIRQAVKEKRGKERILLGVQIIGLGDDQLQRAACELFPGEDRAAAS
jgi:hypothetical protein